MEPSETVGVTVGQQLKNKREELGLSLDDIASQTFIQKYIIEALEKDEFDRIVGEVYTKGFLCQYAEVLKLNSKEILSLYREQIGQLEPAAATEPQPPKQGQTKSKALTILISICILGSIIAMVLIFVPGEQIKTPTASPQPKSTNITEQIPVSISNTDIDITQNSISITSAEKSTIPDNEITDSTWPPIPTSGAKILLQAESTAILEVTIDNLPTARHQLLPGSKIEWYPNKTAHLHMTEKGNVNISMNNTPLKFNIMGIIDLSQE